MKVELRKTNRKNSTKFSLSRYMWTGAAIGLYFGLFFRPLREANYGYALLLALVVAVLLTGLHGWRQRPSLSTVPAYFVFTFVKAALVLLLLEGRHLAFDWGGKTAVTIFTTLMGAVSGLLFAYDQSRQTTKNRKAKTFEVSQAGKKRP